MFCIFIFSYFSDSSPSVLNGLHFYFSSRDSASREYRSKNWSGVTTIIFFHLDKWLGHWEPWTTIFSVVWSIARPINSRSNFYPANRLSVCRKGEWITRRGKRKDESLPSRRDFISFCFKLIIIHYHTKKQREIIWTKDKNWTTAFRPVYLLPLPFGLWP